MSQEPRHITCRTERNALVITVLDPKLNDYHQVQTMKREMEAAIRNSKTKKVAIDMSNVIMVTSVALFPFISARSTAEDAGGRLVLCNMSDHAVHVFTVSQLIVEARSHAKYFSFAEDLESALRQLNEDAPPACQT